LGTIDYVVVPWIWWPEVGMLRRELPVFWEDEHGLNLRKVCIMDRVVKWVGSVDPHKWTKLAQSGPIRTMWANGPAPTHFIFSRLFNIFYVTLMY
jgi:hypothetical protein